MPICISTDQLINLRLRAQRLHPARAATSGDVSELVHGLCAVQAQEAPSAALALRPRSTNLTAAAVEHARVEERSIVRTWAMRGTLHLIAAEDVSWMLPLFGPVFILKNTRRFLELRLEQPVRARAVEVLREALREGPMTRAEIVEALNGEAIPTKGQASAHLLYHAALSGVICYGPDRGHKPTYALVNDWLGEQEWQSQDSSLPKLVRRYLAAHAPAAPEDMVAWSGLAASDVRAAFERVRGELVEVECAGTSYWMLDSQKGWIDAPDDGDPVVRLLPNYDTYLLGWRSRDLILDRRYAKRINAGGGIVKASLMVDGRLAGNWRMTRGKMLGVSVQPFDSFQPPIKQSIEVEVRDLARYLGADPQRVEVKFE